MCQTIVIVGEVNIKYNVFFLFFIMLHGMNGWGLSVNQQCQFLGRLAQCNKYCDLCEQNW